MLKKQRMNITASLNSKYMRYTYVMLTSLFENQPEDVDIYIYLLQSDLTYQDKVYLENLVQSYKGTMHWLQIDRDIFPKSCVVSESWTIETYYRLALMDVLPADVDRILYLDVDTIINKSLAELYATDFGEDVICACPEPFYGTFPDFRNEIFEEQLKQGFTYFNAGVLLLDVNVMRNKYHLEDYLKVAEKLDYKLQALDQDLLNYMHWNEVKIIDASYYNLFARLAYNCDVNYEQVKEESCIIHFLGKKPWSGNADHFDIEKLWWDYAKQTPFYQEFIEEFIKGADSDSEAQEILYSLTGEKNEMSEKRKIKTAIQYMKCLWQENIPQYIYQNGFMWTELPLEKIEEYEQWKENVVDRSKIPTVEGITLNGKDINEDMLFYAIIKAEEMGASYVVINTEEVAFRYTITDVLEKCIDLIMDKDIEIYLENGYVVSKQGTYQYSAFSEIGELKKIAVQFNRICEKECFGISLNVGNANLLVKNLRVMAEEAGELLKLIHANDNDGVSNDHQMPFTFTIGRGTRTTDWYRLIGALVKMKYEGRIVFNVSGVFEKAPAALHNSFISLLAGIVGEWEEQFRMEEYLNQPEKKLIMFGIGGMAYNYMNNWSEKYRPDFLVDNNPSFWGSQRFGVEVKSPTAILEIPEAERNVWICNMFYDQVGFQLEQMGISYRCYNDNYYM